MLSGRRPPARWIVSSPIISGAGRDTPVATIRASGRDTEVGGPFVANDHQRGGAVVQRAGIAAVTVPSTWNTRFETGQPFQVVCGRGPSSASMTVPSGNVTGVISLVQKPFAAALPASVCDRSANSSWSARVMPRRPATFSAVLAHPDVSSRAVRRLARSLHHGRSAGLPGWRCGRVRCRTARPGRGSDPALGIGVGGPVGCRCRDPEAY